MSNTKETVTDVVGKCKKLKVASIVLNVIFLMATIIFNGFMYRWISANDYLAVQYLGYKKLIFAESVLLLIFFIAVALKGGKKRYIFSIVISVIMIIALIAGSILEVIYHNKIVNVFNKADKTLDTIVEQSKLSTDEYGFYVLKDNKAESLADIKDYSIGISQTYPKEDLQVIEDAFEKEVSQKMEKQDFKDPMEMAKRLLENEETKVLVLNNAMIELIENAGDDDNDDKKNGEYADFSSKIRCIYTVSVKNAVKTRSNEKKVTSECFTVYVSGIDVEGDITTKSRSDVNIIMTINPVTHQVLLVSTPRDYYVPLSISGGSCDKLTHAGNYGIDVSIDTLEQLYGIEIDYFVRMNFTGFVNIIDALGGIDLDSDYTFYTHGCQFYEGLNEDVPGDKAIWFARERHSFADGDRQRGKNQMKVIESVIKKCMSPTLLKRYDDIMNSVAESFQTNMGKGDIRALVNFQVDESPKWKIQTYSVSGTGGKATTYSVPNAYAYVMYPDEESVNTAKAFMDDMNHNKKIKVPKDDDEESEETSEE
ncbi:MAG: LCP family protein [Eubacterium sp.]|nr:LCP family protein [Eubacterium sp.]